MVDRDPVAALQESLLVEWQKITDVGAIPAGVVDIELTAGSSFMSFLTNDILVKLKAYVLSTKLPPHVVHRTVEVPISQPASTWQMFKQQHAGTWWLRWLATRRPPRLTVVDTAKVTLEAEWKQMITYPWQQFAVTRREFGAARRVVDLVVSDRIDFRNSSPDFDRRDG
jgi:hypothetical protein